MQNKETVFKSYNYTDIGLAFLVIMTLNSNTGIDIIDAICIYLVK